MSDMALELKPRKITVPEYHRMAEEGILRDDERLELLDGAIIEMSPIGHAHWFIHSTIVDYLIRTLGERASIIGQFTLPLGDFNEPQPDIGVFAAPLVTYRTRFPTAGETYALIEIADTSLAKDTGPKRELYARSGIREYLVVDIRSGTLRRYTNPDGERYVDLTHLRYGETFSLEALPEFKLAVDPFLPPQAR